MCASASSQTDSTFISQPSSYAQAYKHLLINHLVFNVLRWPRFSRIRFRLFLGFPSPTLMGFYSQMFYVDTRLIHTIATDLFSSQDSKSKSQCPVGHYHQFPHALLLLLLFRNGFYASHLSEEEDVYSAMTVSASNIMPSTSAYETTG